MNKNQINMLIANGYSVLDEVNFIKQSDIEPNIRIAYDEALKKFVLNIVSTTLYENVIEEYILILLERGRFIKKLNFLSKECD